MTILKNNSFLLLIAFLSNTWILQYNIQSAYLPKFKTIQINFPRDKRKPYLFSCFSLSDQIKTKKKIKVEIDGERLINQKKIELIRYEARKLKYTGDTTTVMDITFTKEANYGEVLQLLNICYEDHHKKFAFLGNRLIIFGEYPSLPKNKPKELLLVNL
jgi:biopolymer transport protein ExbD